MNQELLTFTQDFIKNHYIGNFAYVKNGEEVARKNNLEELLDPQTASTFYVFVPEKMKLVAKEFGVHMDEYEEFSLV